MFDSILKEFHDIAMFFETLLLVGVYTGSVLTVLIALAYELVIKRGRS